MTRRTLIGFFAILLIAVGIPLWVNSGNSATMEGIASGCIRAGLVMTALYLAYPVVSRAPPWMYGAIAIGCLLVVLNKKNILWVVPALYLLWFIKPKTKQA
jgi:hypothetical protein